MSKQQEQIRRAAQKTRAVLGRHVGDFSHTLESAEYNLHGHAAGRQGKGHSMPKSNLNLQTGAQLARSSDSDHLNCHSSDCHRFGNSAASLSIKES
jgi:hypothetical protein